MNMNYEVQEHWGIRTIYIYIDGSYQQFKRFHRNQVSNGEFATYCRELESAGFVRGYSSWRVDVVKRKLDEVYEEYQKLKALYEEIHPLRFQVNDVGEH
jgi:hypothetical protein